MHPKKQLRNEAMASAPGLLTLHRPDGTAWEILVGPPSKDDQLRLYKWAKAKYDPLDFLKDLDTATKAAYIQASAAAATGVKKAMTADDLERIILSPEGVTQQVYLSAVRYDKTITLKAVAECVTADTFIGVQCDFDDATTAKMPKEATTEQAARWEADPATGLPFRDVGGVGGDSPRRVVE